MQLMKWFRKNNQKLMAIVVIVLMFAFVGGTALTRSCESIGQSRNKTVATFGQNQKIKLPDLNTAQIELAILKELKADLLLRSLPVPILQTNSLHGIVLGEILFPESAAGGPLAASYLKQAKMYGFTISDKQIYDIYKRSEPAYVYWLLLEKEAQQAGIRIPNDQTRLFLNNFIPQVFQGATYAQVINSIVNAPLRSEAMRVSEYQVISAFSNLIAVLEYGRTICSTENLTAQQIKHYVKSSLQTVDVNFVKFDSDVFAKDAPEPNDNSLNEQFEKYKDYFAGQFSDQNPYGFGYKIPDCAQLQYIAIKLDDVEKIVPKPSQEELEQYYNKYKAYLTEKIPSDPNDPNSPAIDRTKNFAEVADTIEQTLLQQKIDTKSNQIIQKAISLTESPEADSKQISPDQFSKIENNYTTAAEQLKREYNIEIIAGQTGLLTAPDFQQDAILGKLILKAAQFDPVRNPTFERLYKLVFAVDQLGTSEIDTINIQKPQMYKNIGPLDNLTGKIKAIVRIIKTRKAAPPESINQSFSKDTIYPEPNNQENQIYSVKDTVAKDLKKLTAMSLAKEKAEEFGQQVEATGNWQQIVDKLNKLYPKDPNKKPSDTNNFELVSLAAQQQISEATIQILKIQSIGNPAMESDLPRFLKQRLFISQLNELASKAIRPKTPFVWEFKPDLCCYLLKDLSSRPVYQNDYDNQKVRQMFLEDTLRSQSLALVHFNPDNILKRNNFKWLQERRKTPENDANQPNT
jgi:hypothetical protein